MLEKEFNNIVKTIPLEYACNHSKDKKYYLFDNSEFTCIIIVDKNVRAGGVLICAGDIQCTIFENYQNKHYLSNLFRSAFWKRHFYYIDRFSIDKEHISGIDDFNKKLHLAKILKAKVTNIESAFDYTVNNYGDDKDKYYYNSCLAIKLYKYNLNNYYNYKEMIDICKLCL